MSNELNEENEELIESDTEDSLKKSDTDGEIDADGESDTEDDLDTEDESGDDSKKEKEHLIANPVHREIVSFMMTFVVAIVIAYIINSFVLSSNTVPSESMENTIETGARLFGNRLSYLTKDPERGDVVIFKYPVDEKILYIKRIIGIPGDTVEIVNGVLYINGEVYEEDYLKEDMKGSFGPYEVPEDSYFMMGDNRNNSGDSRYWNDEAIYIHGYTVDDEHDYTFVKKDKIVSKAMFEYYPHIKKLN